MNPLEVNHTSVRSTYRQKMGPKGFKHLRNFSRELEHLPKSRDTQCIYSRLRLYTRIHAPYPTVLSCNTWFSITIVFLRVVYEGILLFTEKYEAKRRSYTNSVFEDRIRPYFSVYGRIRPWLFDLGY